MGLKRIWQGWNGLLLAFYRLLDRWHVPGAQAVQSFIGRRILGAFSLIRTAIMVTGVVNFLLFQYLDSAEAQERNKLAEAGKLDHLSFVVATQSQVYESAVWETGVLLSTVTGRDLYSGEATDDILALRQLNPALLAPGGALHSFLTDYLQLEDLWHGFTPVLQARGDRAPLQAAWNAQRALITGTPAELDAYRRTVQVDLDRLQVAKSAAKQTAVTISLLVGIISFGLAIALAAILAGQIVPPVTRLKDALQRVAEGDLSPGPVPHGHDEITDLLTTFNESLAKLRALLGAVQGQAHDLGVEARRLQEELAGGALASEEAATLQETLATIDQLGQAATSIAGLAGTLAGSTGELQTVRAESRNGPGSAVAQAPDGAVILAADTQAIANLDALLTEVAGETAALARQVASQVPGAGPYAGRFVAIAEEVNGLAAHADRAASQMRGLLDEVHRTRAATVASAARLHQVADYLRQATDQFRFEKRPE